MVTDPALELHPSVVHMADRFRSWGIPEPEEAAWSIAKQLVAQGWQPPVTGPLSAGFDPNAPHRLRTSGRLSCDLCGRTPSDRLHDV